MNTHKDKGESEIKSARLNHYLTKPMSPFIVDRFLRELNKLADLGKIKAVDIENPVYEQEEISLDKRDLYSRYVLPFIERRNVERADVIYSTLKLLFRYMDCKEADDRLYLYSNYPKIREFI